VGIQDIEVNQLIACDFLKGAVDDIFADNQLIETIRTYQGQPVLLIQATRDSEELRNRECRTVEINFSTVSIDSNGDIEEDEIVNALPRFQVFGVKDTVIEMKKKVFSRIKHLWTQQEVEKATDEWINSQVIMMIKEKIKDRQVSSKCEFCGR
jgi:hypothetical protein